MSGVAAIILAHNDPPKVRRLIGALAGADVFLHCDLRTPDPVASAMTDGLSSVRLVPRRPSRTFAWSVVDAELRGLAMALEHSSAEHIVVMSGSCYPLASIEAIADELTSWRGISRLELNPIPYSGWGRGSSNDGGTWRFERRFLSFRGSVISYRERPFPIPFYRRRPPAELVLTGSAQWKIYARDHASKLLQVFDSGLGQIRFWRSIWCPDEAAVASILRSPAIVGDVADRVIDDLPWYMRWGASPHPAWLTEDDLSHLRRAAAAPDRPVEGPRVGDRSAFKKLFARKIGSGEGRLLDAIDAELRA